jgi:hypothetical protein
VNLSDHQIEEPKLLDSLSASLWHQNLLQLNRRHSLCVNNVELLLELAILRGGSVHDEDHLLALARQVFSGVNQVKQSVLVELLYFH